MKFFYTFTVVKSVIIETNCIWFSLIAVRATDLQNSMRVAMSKETISNIVCILLSLDSITEFILIFQHWRRICPVTWRSRSLSPVPYSAKTRKMSSRTRGDHQSNTSEAFQMGFARKQLNTSGLCNPYIVISRTI